MRVHEEWILLPQRIAVHEPSGVAVVADVHLGYSEARRRQGDAVPLPSVAAALAPLARAAVSLPLQGLVVAGDLFERGFDAGLYRSLLDVLEELRLPLLALVPGNHDRGVETGVTAQLLRPQGYRLGGWHICHGDAASAEGNLVHGHLHPAVRWRGRKRPCFVVGPRRLILPAFSEDAAGTALAPEFRGPGWRHVAIHEGRLAPGLRSGAK